MLILSVFLIFNCNKVCPLQVELLHKSEDNQIISNEDDGVLVECVEVNKFVNRSKTSKTRLYLEWNRFIRLLP